MHRPPTATRRGPIERPRDRAVSARVRVQPYGVIRPELKVSLGKNSASRLVLALTYYTVYTLKPVSYEQEQHETLDFDKTTHLTCCESKSELRRLSTLQSTATSPL